MAERKSDYAEFWPYYLQEHGKSNTRVLHFIGTGGAIIFAFNFLLNLHWPSLILAVVCGYFFAWLGHFLIEKNRPATFTHPIWSLISDFRMFFLWLGRGLDDELARAAVSDDAAAAEAGEAGSSSEA
ncbi:MAG: Mpo1-like protein [Alphaproteobacteria bacterium]